MSKDKNTLDKAEKCEDVQIRLVDKEGHPVLEADGSEVIVTFSADDFALLQAAACEEYKDAEMPDEEKLIRFLNAVIKAKLIYDIKKAKKEKAEKAGAK